MDRFPDEEMPEYMARNRRVIGLAMKVHRILGCGFTEQIYRDALVIELHSAGIAFEVHPSLPVFYAEQNIGTFQTDIIIESKLIIELKAVEALAIAHSVQLVSYLAAAQIEHGLLLNFGTKSLQFKTKTRSSPSDDPPNPPNLHS
jgi:GxxExxY protein